MSWFYQKYDDEKQKLIACPNHDLDCAITGKSIYGLPAWFDENPDERIRLGWIKHIRASKKDVQYDPQTQFLVKETVMIDEYTVKDIYHVLNKTEEMMAREESEDNGGLLKDLIWGVEFDE